MNCLNFILENKLKSISFNFISHRGEIMIEFRIVWGKIPPSKRKKIWLAGKLFFSIKLRFILHIGKLSACLIII